MGESFGRRRARRSSQLTLVLLAAAALAGGCGGSARPSSTSAATRTTPQRNDKYAYARARFREMCAGCHTLADAGAHGPRFDLDHVPILNRALVRFVIHDGEPGMPGWGDVLSRREFEELARYVLAVAQRTEGEDHWGWQMRLRMSGGAVKPKLPDLPRGPAPERASATATTTTE
jgi:mono/diheme cytochrome c family protein